MVPEVALPLYMLHGMLQGASSPHTFGLQRSYGPRDLQLENVQIHFYMKKSFNGAILVFECNTYDAEHIRKTQTLVVRSQFIC